jgi:hypothetical protein
MRSPESSSRRLGAGASFAALLFVACAHRPAPKPRTIAIVPVDVLGLPGEHGETLGRALETEVTKQAHNRLAEREAIRAALPADEAARTACLEAEACLIGVGKRVHAELVLSLRLAGLGNTHVIRARLLDVGRGILVKDLQETGAGGADALAGHARAVSHRLFPPPVEKRRWWLWALAGAAVAATTAAVVVTRGNDGGVIHVGDL